MPEENPEQLRVLHLVSSAGVTGATQQSLFMPLLTRTPKHRVKAEVVSFAPGFALAALLRQSGVPVHDVALSRHRFSASAPGELMAVARKFRPDVIQAWGLTAQLASLSVRSRCGWKPKVIWTVADSTPPGNKAGWLERKKFGYAKKYAQRPDRIVFDSEAGAAAYRRMGYPEATSKIILPGVDPMRFKPDQAARRKIREQLSLPPNCIVIGMAGPFQPDYDHATLLKGVGEMIKTDPNLHVLLAGRGLQKGNGPLMALVGGGTLSTRTRLLGEWSDMASFYNACDIACSTALTDESRMSLVMAMLCGVPCVATAVGAQGEIVGRFGVGIEAGGDTALIRGVKRILEMPADRKAFMKKNARKHALSNFVYVRTLQNYLNLYFEVIGKQVAAASDVPMPQIDESIPEPAADTYTVKPRLVTLESSEMPPDAVTSKIDAMESIPERKPAEVAAPLQHKPVIVDDGEALRMFEANLTSTQSAKVSPMAEQARGVAEEIEDLIAPEALQVAASEASVTIKTPKPQPEVSVPVAAPAAVPVAAPVAVSAAAPVVQAAPQMQMSAQLDLLGEMPIKTAVEQPSESAKPGG